MSSNTKASDLGNLGPLVGDIADNGLPAGIDVENLPQPSISIIRAAPHLPLALRMASPRMGSHDMDVYEKHDDNLTGKYRSIGWILVIAVAALGIALLLKEYDVF